MNAQIKELVNKFISIKKEGWIKSIKKGSNGVGMTFEALLGIPQNNFEIPDYNGIEIKTKRSYSKSYTTLFNCKPEGPHCNEIERLKNKYGYPDKILKQYKVINNSIYTNQLTKITNNYYFKLYVNKQEEKIYLYVYNKNNMILEKHVYWTFDTLKEKLYRKVNIIAFIDAKQKFIDNNEYFKYYKLTLYVLKNFETFINLIEQGIIRITFKIGVFRDGNRIGQTHNHGTGFDINKNDIKKLYTIYKY